MAIKRRAGKKKKGDPPAKRPARGARLQDDPVWSTTNQDSNLVTENLHAKFADPKCYEGMTKEDWEDLRIDSLPVDAPYSEDGYSVPIQYFKYDLTWRRLIREFQEDLGAGRYEPEWQAAAKEAMEQRARGDFDKFKEDEYEEFWGQKQKMDHRALAGESAKIKLEELVQTGVVKVGDILSYSRVFRKGKGKGADLVEKEAKVVGVRGSMTIFEIPPGRQKFVTKPDTPFAGARIGDDTITASNGVTDSAQDFQRVERDKDLKEAEIDHSKENGSLANDQTSTESRLEEVANTAKAFDQNDVPPPKGCSHMDSASQAATSTRSTTLTSTDNQNIQYLGTATQLVVPIILVQADNPTSLESAILATDGRFQDGTTPRSANAWRTMRGIRNNQDMGTLWEMREEYFVYKDPTIPKMPKKQGSVISTVPTANASNVRSRADRYAARGRD